MILVKDYEFEFISKYEKITIVAKKLDVPKRMLVGFTKALTLSRTIAVLGGRRRDSNGNDV